MKTKMIPCEIETPDYRIEAKAIAHTVRDGQVVVCIKGHAYYESIPLDDLTDNSRLSIRMSSW